MSTTNDKRQKQIEALIILYLLTDAEINDMSVTIKIGMVAAMRAAYRWASKQAGIAQEWFPSEAQKQALEDRALQQAQGIAETYQSDLQGATDKFLEAYEQANGALDDNALPQLQDMLQEWTDARNQWKSEEVASYSVDQGATDGTLGFVDDVLDGEYDVELDNVSVDINSLWLGIMPDYALSNDECNDWAGMMVPLLEAGSLPYVPAHPSCIHTYCLINE